MADARHGLARRQGSFLAAAAITSTAKSGGMGVKVMMEITER
jgi:hypothetical protein